MHRNGLVIAHFHKDGKLRSDTLSILQCLVPLFDHVIFVSTFMVQHPQRLVANFFERCLSSPDFDVLGLTHSNEVQPHLQSYLMTFSSHCTRHPAFIEWWDQMTPRDERYAVVFHCELGLSNMLQKNGMALTAVLNTPPLPANNPSHFHYKALLEQFGILKIELLKSNPFELDLDSLTCAMAQDVGFAELVGESLEN